MKQTWDKCPFSIKCSFLSWLFIFLKRNYTKRIKKHNERKTMHQKRAECLFYSWLDHSSLLWNSLYQMTFVKTFFFIKNSFRHMEKRRNTMLFTKLSLRHNPFWEMENLTFSSSILSVCSIQILCQKIHDMDLLQNLRKGFYLFLECSRSICFDWYQFTIVILGIKYFFVIIWHHN